MTNRPLMTACWVLAVLLGVFSTAGSAATIILEGNYMRTAVDDYGTLGAGGSTSPGLLHDSSGTGTFGADDWITPGDPYAGWSVACDQIGDVYNNNNTGRAQDPISGTATAYAGLIDGQAYDNAAEWTGANATFSVTQYYYFNDDDELINIEMTITALTDLTNVQAAHYFDPDPGGSSLTDNERGSVANGLATSDWVQATSVTDAVMGMYSDSAVTHNAAIINPWNQDPSLYLANAVDSLNADAVIGIGFDIGTLNNGDSATLNLMYAAVAQIDDLDIGGPGDWIGGTDMLWSTPANWDPNTVPGDGQAVTITGANTAINHDVAGTPMYNGVTFDNTAGAFTVTGNALGVADGQTIENQSASLQTFSADVVAEGDLSIVAGAGGFSFANLSTAAASAVAFDTGSATSTITGVVSGSSSLTVTGSGVLVLSGANTYGGGTTVTAGTLTGTTTSLQGDITNNSVVVFDQAADGTYASVISGTGTLTKLGAGNVTLGGANTYSGGTTVTAGTLTGTTTSLQGDITNNSVVVFDQAADGTYASVISGTGALTKLGAGALTLSGASTYLGATNVTAGTLVLGGTSGTGLMTVANGATLTGAGTVGGNLRSDGTTAPGNSIGTLNVAGDYTLGATGTLDVEIAKVAGNPEADLVNATGSATLENGSTIDVTDISTPGNEVLTDEDYTIIAAGGGVTDNGATITSNSAFLSFTGAVAGNDYVLTAHRQMAFAPTAATENNRQVAKALDTDSPAATDAYATMINNLLLLNAATFNKQARLLSGEPHFSMSDMATRSGDRTAGNIRRYLSGRRQGPVGVAATVKTQAMSPAIASTADDPSFLAMVVAAAEEAEQRQASQPEPVDRRWQVTAMPFGDFYARQTTSNQIGYNACTTGVTIAVDRNLSERTLVGLHASYGHSEVRMRKDAGDGAVDSMRIGPHGTLYGDNAFVEGSVSYGVHMTGVDRDLIVAGLEQTASSDYVAHDVTTEIGGGYTFSLCGWDVTPAAALYYTVYHRPGFDETGAGAGNLSVESETSHSFRSDLELSASKVFDCGGAKVMPEIYGGWRHEYCGNDDLSARFRQGVSGFSLSNDTIRDKAYFGLGVSVLLTEDLSMYVQYEGSVSPSDNANSIAVGAGYRF